MSSDPSGGLGIPPPELPPYLKKVSDLKPIVGVPSDEDIIGIHAVIRVANKVVDVQDMGDPSLLARLSEHLFNAQMARYRSKQLGAVFPEDTTYTPPALPSHVAVRLEPINGVPSEEQIIKVQSAMRAYQHFVNVPSMFDPRVDMELSQHLFDIQMAKYTQRARQSSTTSSLQATSSQGLACATQPASDINGDLNAATNNAGTGALAVDSIPPTQVIPDAGVHDAIERSNRLAEQTNQLAERSNLLMERSNQIAELANRLLQQSGQPTEQSNPLSEKFGELLEKLNNHFERFNRLPEESTKPAERVGDILDKINKVLVAIQHAIVRNHKGNTKHALDCLVNEKGEAPGVSETVGRWDFGSLFERYSSGTSATIPILIDGTIQDFRLPSWLIAKFLCFYGIDKGLCEEGPTPKLKPGMEDSARERLRRYWASCLG